jgi:hypothetical protein
MTTIIPQEEQLSSQLVQDFLLPRNNPPHLSSRHYLLRQRILFQLLPPLISLRFLQSNNRLQSLVSCVRRGYTVMGYASSDPARRRVMSMGCVAAYNCTLGPNMTYKVKSRSARGLYTRSPIVTLAQSSMMSFFHDIEYLIYNNCSCNRILFLRKCCIHSHTRMEARFQWQYAQMKLTMNPRFQSVSLRVLRGQDLRGRRPCHLKLYKAVSR